MSEGEICPFLIRIEISIKAKSVVGREMAWKIFFGFNVNDTLSFHTSNPVLLTSFVHLCRLFSI